MPKKAKQKEEILVPHPKELRAFSIPGYLMPIIAEWLQISTSSAYSFFKAGAIPSRSTMTRLSLSPYFLSVSLWDQPASTRAELAYIRWHSIQKDNERQQNEQNHALNAIL